ncbi:3-oxo-5-alpha-steroid 4-dehydrogenase-domain-containing protein, partial [Lipomyces starkeyi]
GPQIHRRTLLLTAYSGPVFFHILFYYCQAFIYGTTFQHTASQILAFTLITLHFAKRIFETIFVHVFYRLTVSFYSLYLYLFHYWLLSGVFMAYYIYYPGTCSSSISLLSSALETEETSLYFLSAVWIFAELSNFETHLILANLRIRYPRPIPKGYGFDLVSCPNYFFELLAWTVITLITRSLASLLFLIAAGLHMWRKAARKHEMYKKEFGSQYPKYRKVLIPYVK